MKRRRLRRGLRIQLLLALLLTSLATLGVATTVLLSRQLTPDLREQSAANLRAAVLASRPQFEEAMRNRRVRRSRAEELRQRTDARVVVDDLGPADEFEYDTNPGSSTRGVARDRAAHQPHADHHHGDRGRRRPHRRAPVRREGRSRSACSSRSAASPRSTTAVDQVRNALLAAGAVGLLVAIALAVALSSTLLRRLGRLRVAVLRITEEGVTDTPLQHDEGRDEVGDLARAFGRMQEELAPPGGRRGARSWRPRRTSCARR